MASNAVIKFPANEWLEVSGKSMIELAEATGLHIDTVRLAFIGGVHKLKISSALLIAEALEVPYKEIRWAVETTDRGREPLTGGKYTTGHTTPAPTCPEHFIELPSSGECYECAA